VASPNVSGESYTNTITGVSCWSPRGCVAVGSRITTSGLTQTLVMAWNGKAWHIVPSPNRGAGDNVLTGIACPRATSCMAVGWDQDPADGPLVESWDGASWTLAQIPLTNPVATQAVTLASVSCPAPGRCVAVGGYDPDGQPIHNLALRRSAAGWSFARLPSPGTKTNDVTAVSCADVRHCMAVGEHSDRTRTWATVTLALSMSGTTWRVTRTPNPTPADASGIPYNHLAGVSCPTATRCVAVGKYHSNVTADLQTLVESWNGHRWTRVRSPDKPQGANNDSRLYAVSCASTVACAAVGSYAPNNPSQTLVEAWNGSRWVIRPSADAKPNGIITTNQLYGVSCPSPFACVATGDTMAGFAGTNTVTHTLTELGPAVPRPRTRVGPTVESRAPAAATRTSLTLLVHGCNGCTVQPVRAGDTATTPVWRGRKKKVENGSVHWTVSMRHTVGMSFDINDPGAVNVGAVPDIVVAYRGIAVGDLVPAGVARHKKRANGCWAGTRAPSITLRVRVERFRTTSAYPPPVTGYSIRPYFVRTRPHLRLASGAEYGRTFHGAIGNQDAYFCHT
jgi:hypothetical protein